MSDRVNEKVPFMCLCCWNLTRPPLIDRDDNDASDMDGIDDEEKDFVDSGNENCLDVDKVDDDEDDADGHWLRLECRFRTG